MTTDGRLPSLEPIRDCRWPALGIESNVAQPPALRRQPADAGRADREHGRKGRPRVSRSTTSPTWIYSRRCRSANATRRRTYLRIRTAESRGLSAYQDWIRARSFSRRVACFPPKGFLYLQSNVRATQLLRRLGNKILREENRRDEIAGAIAAENTPIHDFAPKHDTYPLVLELRPLRDAQKRFAGGGLVDVRVPDPRRCARATPRLSNTEALES